MFIIFVHDGELHDGKIEYFSPVRNHLGKGPLIGNLHGISEKVIFWEETDMRAKLLLGQPVH